jgi:phytoene dehydrogenase-like protein
VRVCRRAAAPGGRHRAGAAPARLRPDLIDPALWCPFPDGTSLAVFADADRTTAQVAALAPDDVRGYLAYEALFARLRRILRCGSRDTWVGPSPDRAELAELFADDPEGLDVLLHRSIADVVEQHVRDERLRAAPRPGRDRHVGGPA